MEKENNWALNNRILLKREVSNHFKENIQIRVNEAIKRMKLHKEKIITIFCNSINKHTCMIEKSQEMYLVFDEHHIEVLSVLNFLYYSYGKSNFKFPLYQVIISQYDYFEKRLKSIVSLLLSEKKLLRGDVEEALHYAKNVQKYTFCIDNDDLFTLFFHNLTKQDIAQSLSLNFYVFHELAHVKFLVDNDELWYICKIVDDMAEKMVPIFEMANKGKYRIIINNQECVCDIYAMILLFDYMYDHTDKNVDFYMIESYMISIINIVIMDSIRDSITDDLDEWYVNVYVRIILVVNVLGFLLMEGEKEFMKFQSYMNLVREQYENYKKVFDIVWDNIHNQCKTTQKVKYMSEEWYILFEMTLDIISSYK